MRLKRSSGPTGRSRRAGRDRRARGRGRTPCRGRRSERFAIPPETFRSAEYIKSHLGGFDPDEFEADARAAGFGTCDATYEWFLGQAVLMHGDSGRCRRAVERHLRRLLPVARPSSSTCGSRRRDERPYAEPTRRDPRARAIRDRGFAVVPAMIDADTVSTMKDRSAASDR